MNEGSTFWFVQKVDGHEPTYRHPSRESAIDEAKRLANVVGGEYYVLKAEAIVRRVTVQVVALTDTDGIPF